MLRWYAVLAAVCTGWGTIPLLVRDVDLDAPLIVFGRVWVAAAGLLAALAVRGRQQGPRLLSVAPGRCLLVGAVLAAHWSAMFAGYARGPDDVVILVIFLAPIGIAALAPRVLGERLTARTVAALGLAVAGFGLVASPTIAGGDAAALVLGATAAALFVALVLMSKPLAVVYGGVRLTLMEMLVAGVVLAPVAILADWGRPDAQWAWLLVLGLVHTAFGTAVYLAALARVPATHAGILGYLEPVGVVVFAWLLIGDAPAPSTAAGGALIVAAGVLVVAASRDPHSPAKVPLGVPG